MPVKYTSNSASSSTGDVVGPGSSTNNALVRFNGVTGKLVQDGPATLSDGGALLITAPSGSDSSFTLADDDIAHGMTSLVATNVYSRFGTLSSINGGVFWQAFSAGDNGPYELQATIGSAVPASTTAAIRFSPGKRSGTGQGALDAADTAFDMYTGATLLFRVKGDGKITIVAPLSNAFGSVSDPAYTFTGDTDTGIYRSAANCLSITSGATQAFNFEYAAGFGAIFRFNDAGIRIRDLSGVEYISFNGFATAFTFGGNIGSVSFNQKVTITGARVLQAQGADVASANDLTLGTDGNVFEITGATQINAITTANWQNGSLITLLFTSNPTVKHNTAGGAGTAVILLAGAADFGATAGDTLTLRLSEIGGAQAWREVSRAVI